MINKRQLFAMPNIRMILAAENFIQQQGMQAEMRKFNSIWFCCKTITSLGTSVWYFLSNLLDAYYRIYDTKPVRSCIFKHIFKYVRLIGKPKTGLACIRRFFLFSCIVCCSLKTPHYHRYAAITFSSAAVCLF